MTTEINCPDIDEYLEPFCAYFHRSESRERLNVILMDGERKSVEPMSEKI